MSRSRIAASVSVPMLLATLLVAACSRLGPHPEWKSASTSTDAEFNGIWFTDSLNGWVTGGGRLVDGGLVGRTRDGGRTWQFRSGILQTNGTPFTLHRVQFADTLHGCVVADGGLVLLTDDGGITWREVDRGRDGGDLLFDLQILHGRRGWAAGPTRLVTTPDGGQNWGALLDNTSGDNGLAPNAVHFVDEQHGWLACRGGQLMHSDDGGQTWLPVSLPLHSGSPPTFWDITFSDSLTGWVVGEQGAIFHTGDGGATWVKQQNGVPIVRVIPRGAEQRAKEAVPEPETTPEQLTLTAVRFANARQGWAIGYYPDVGESVVLATGDGGETWRTDRVEAGQYLRALFVLDARHAWTAGQRARTAQQVVLRYGPGRER
jgi:photosystem II stability/assembly factor-like uncharacterized protein